ncbi:MAG: ribonuclease HII [Bacteroidota bacterium]
MLAPYLHEDQIEAGCDEAGRGCLAGPVVAAAVILPPNTHLPKLNDSKKLSEKQRGLLRVQIQEQALAYAIGIVENQEIDDLNILNASIEAMHRAVKGLAQLPEHLLIDGNRFHPYETIPHTCVIKGDGKYMSIAAASILAKTFRDDLMVGYHQKHPQYNWLKNKGYPTKAHRAAIEVHGISKLHRLSFKLQETQTKLIFPK